jgi:N-acetylmuramoyl-L-alanine amidase
VKLNWFLPALVGMVLVGVAAEAATLEQWRFDRGQNRLELRTDQRVQPRAKLLSQPTRLVIDLPGIILGRPLQSELVGGAIRSLRVGQFDRNTTRVVVELAPGYTIDPKAVRLRGVYANEWVVQLPEPELMPPSVPNDPDPGEPDTRPLPVAAETVILVPFPEQTRLSPATDSPRAATRPASQTSLPVLRNPHSRVVVVVDPGHGGPDPGAIGIGGLREVDVVMPISLRVADILRREGIEAVLTREDDRDLGLEPRVQIANRLNATIFVSIHANAISLSRPDVNGLETYYFSSGKALADTIHRSILEMTGVRDRRVRQARFYVLRRTSMPSVLVEVGFVTGAEDAPRLRDPAFQNRMAEAIARGIIQYLQPGR